MDHVGIDLHQKYSEACALSSGGEVKWRRRLPTTEASLRRVFGKRDRMRIVMESSGQTPWVARVLEELGHEVVVVNPRRVRLIAESTLKTDRTDAEILARLSLLGSDWLHPVYQRSRGAQHLRLRLKTRQKLVRMRASLIHTVRGSLAAHGYRLRSCAAVGFVAVFAEARLPEELREGVEPLIATLGELSERIDQVDAELRAEARLDELVLRLQSVPGVGPVVALAFIAWMDRPERFVRSHDVGACLGLRPRLRASAGREQWGRITREGDCEMRRLLVQAAHAALKTKADSALKRWAQGLAERLGTGKAVVALARKIGVLLHRLWITGESFQPFPRAR